VDCDPLTGLVPVHDRDAAQDVAFDADQVSVDELPLITEFGTACRLTVGGGALTETTADWLAVPPSPVHVSVYVDVAVSAPVDCVPCTAFAPDQAPEAVQAVAFVAVQLRVALPPLVTALGPTLKLTVGVGEWTVTVVD